MPADTPMVLVPREPTEEMVRAGVRCAQNNHRDFISAAWPAMLSASPAREGEPERMLCNLCKRPVNAGHPSEWCTCHPYMAPAGTHVAPSTPATPEGLLSDANIDVAARTLEALADELSETLGARAQEGGGGGSEAERELLRAFTRVLAALQPQAGEGE